MARITIRRLKRKTQARRGVRAARHGLSTGEEGNLADAIRARFRRVGGVDLRIPARGVALVDPWKA